jgi:hypothetical protein
MAYFGTVTNTGNASDNADPDGDGSTNGQEFTAGTNPKNAASVLNIASVQTNGNDIVVSFASVAGKIYRLERSATLQSGSWATVRENISGTGGVVQVTDTNAALQPARFYRLNVQ